MYSDTSNTEIGTFFEFIHKDFASTEKCRSSTRQELEAIYLSLFSLPQFLNNNSLFWHTDNFAAGKIVGSGSSKSDLQTKVIEIFDICKIKNLNV